jgi:hypothetical protein
VGLVGVEELARLLHPSAEIARRDAHATVTDDRTRRRTDIGGSLPDACPAQLQ